MKRADTAGTGASADDCNLQFLFHIPHYFLKVKGHNLDRKKHWVNLGETGQLDYLKVSKHRKLIL